MDLSTRTTPTNEPTRPRELRLGVPGFTFLDLHRPERLADLHAALLAYLETLK